tara:strand:+ start:7415 stop:8560 length:1146 start_codon:yes stop_codon:yes gene_type:complete
MVKKTKKTSRPIKIKGGSGTQVFDLDKFNAIYDKWKQECNVKGSALGLTSEVSLLELVSGHGVVARPYTKNTVSRDKGAGTILEMMDEWENDITILEMVDIIALDEIIEKLETMADSDNDPRNIRFTVPIPSEVDEDTGDYDEDDVTEVYGHYRTPDYIEFRKILSEIPGSKVNAETIEAVDSSWYAEGKGATNSAEPPMWQALFSKGSNLVSLGLLSVCKEAKKLIGESEIENLVLPVMDEGDGLLAEEIFRLPAVKKWVMEKVGTATSPGVGINKKTLHWSDRPMHRDFQSQKFDVQGVAESNFIKRAAGYEKYAGVIQTVQFVVSRRQVRKLATVSKVCKKYPGRDVVYHISKDTKKAKPKKAAKKKEVKKWMEVIGK